LWGSLGACAVGRREGGAALWVHNGANLPWEGDGKKSDGWPVPWIRLSVLWCWTCGV
jgi:hypothetical protein